MSVLVVLSTSNSDRAPDSAPRRNVANLPSIELTVVHIDRDGPYRNPVRVGARGIDEAG